MLLTALFGGLVVGLEEALAGVTEDAAPWDLLEEAELGVVVDEHHPAADLLQGTEPQRPHRQVPQRQRVGAAAETPPGERVQTTPPTTPCPPTPRPRPRSLVQHTTPDDPQVLEDAQVLQIGRPGSDVEEACGEPSVTTPCVRPPAPCIQSPQPLAPSVLTRQLFQALEDPQQFGVQGRRVGAGVPARDGREVAGGCPGSCPQAWGGGGRARNLPSEGLGQEGQAAKDLGAAGKVLDVGGIHGTDALEEIHSQPVAHCEGGHSRAGVLHQDPRSPQNTHCSCPAGRGGTPPLRA